MRGLTIQSESRRHGRQTHADTSVERRIPRDEVQHDDPGDELAHGGVGIGVGRAAIESMEDDAAR